MNLRTAIAYFSIATLSSCGGGSRTDVDAFVFPLLGNQTLPQSVSVTVQGRDPNEFSPEVLAESSVPGALQVRMSNLPKDEPLMFRVSQLNDLDSIVTFPLLIEGGEPLELPAMPAGTLTAIKMAAEGSVVPANSIDTVNLATVIGEVTPSGLAVNPFISVDVVDQASGNSVLSPGTNGPFYFTNNATPVGGTFQDVDGTYVIFNLPPGNYTMRFNADSGGTAVEYDFVALKGEIIFGYDIPLFSRRS